jgi:hypothetical protein
MKWDITGRYIGTDMWGYEVPDLIIPKYEIEGTYVVFWQS